MPVIVLAGEEEFEIARRAQALRRQLVDPAWAAVNFQKINHPDIMAVSDAAVALPFGSGNKFIQIDNCDLFTKKKSKADDEGGASSKTSAGKTQKLLDDLEGALGCVSESTYLVLACTANFDNTLKISKVFEKHATIENFPKKKHYPGNPSRELLSWCQKEAHRHEAYIDDDAASYLADSCEGNLRQIASEIEKAAVYILPDKKITHDVVANLVGHQSHVFVLLEQWAKGQKENILATLTELLGRQHAMPVLATVQSTLSKWIALKIEADKICGQRTGGRAIGKPQLSAAEIARAMTGGADRRREFILEMDLKRIGSLSLEFLTDKKRELTRLEHLIKMGMLPDDHALMLFFQTAEGKPESKPR